MIPKPPPENPSDPQPDLQYTIQVKGCLKAQDWSEWFGGMTLEVDTTQGETRLVGLIADQAELYRLFSRLRDLGLALISVEPFAARKPE